MDIVVTGRHTTVSDRFRQHIAEKLDKVQQLAPRTRRIEVIVSHEPNRRQAKACDRVEITCHIKGPVVRRKGLLQPVTGLTPALAADVVENLRVRFRTVGDITCTAPVESDADTVAAIIAETATSNITERGATRLDDQASEAAMEQRKKEGYF